MTYKEKLRLLHPECVDDEFPGGCKCCPSTYFDGTEDVCDDMNCIECWNREDPKDINPHKDTLNQARKKLGLDPIVKVQRSETLVIGVDISKDDVPTITVGKLNGIRVDVIKVIRGDAAKDLYGILTDVME